MKAVPSIDPKTGNVVKTNDTVFLPPDVAEAWGRTKQAALLISSVPEMGIDSAAIDGFLKDAEKVFRDKNKWPIILEVYHKAKGKMRQLELPPNLNVFSPQGRTIIENAVDVLSAFIIDALVKIGDVGFGMASFFGGMVKGGLLYDNARLAAAPMLYTKIRMEILGMTPPAIKLPDIKQV